MTGSVVKIQLEGRSSDNGHVRFNEFLSRLESLRQVLTLIEQDLVGGTKSAVVYRVIDLSHSSPASVVLEAKPIRQQVRPELPGRIVDRFFDTLEYLRGSPSPLSEHVTYRVLEAYKGLVATPRRDLEFFVISSNDRTVTVDESLEQKIEGILGDVRTAFGTFTGALDSINLHADANRFTIYPAAGPSRLSCHFRQNQFEQVVGGLGRHVSVKGTLRFHGKDPFPHSVEVEELKVLPRDSELPSLMSIRGIAPKATRGKDSVAFVRSLRDEDS
jgi:hypothetical protein